MQLQNTQRKKKKKQSSRVPVKEQQQTWSEETWVMGGSFIWDLFCDPPAFLQKERQLIKSNWAKPKQPQQKHFYRGMQV